MGAKEREREEYTPLSHLNCDYGTGRKEQTNANTPFDAKIFPLLCKHPFSLSSVQCKTAGNTIHLIDLSLPGTTHLLLQWKEVTKHFLNQTL